MPGVALEDRSLMDRASDWTVAPRGPAFRWGFALGAFVVATALRFAIDGYLPAGFPFLTFFPAVALTAILAGPFQGLVVAALCLIVAWVAFIPPYFTLAVSSSHLVALALYVVVVAIELGLVVLMRRSLVRLAMSEARARELARSRTLMFHELQHRVSNNLAVVGSLLQLQRREVTDPAAQRALEQSAARVNVVSRLNRLLHDPQAQEIDFAAFLRAVVPDAAEAAGVGERVRVSVAAEPVLVPAGKAVPLGLVATELLANAFEHGFADGRRGRVHVALEREGDGDAVLVVRDDGAGLPPGFDLERSRSLGLMIAQQFAGQLGAELSVVEEGGVVSRLRVPLGG